jgi:hypothetical protein
MAMDMGMGSFSMDKIRMTQCKPRHMTDIVSAISDT